MLAERYLTVLAPGGETLSQRERSPPPKPISLEFPNYIPPRCDSPLNQEHIKKICQGLASVRRLADIKDSHLGHLNVHLEQDVSLSDMVTDERFKTRPLLYDADLTAMLAELEVDNEDAYREILRLPPFDGRKKPRLAYSRNFFASLEDMSRYWDASEDNYYEVDTNDADDLAKDVQGPCTEVKVNGGSSNASMNSDAQNTHVFEQVEAQAPLCSSAGSSATSQTMEMPSRPKKKQVYKGHRLGNGEQMSPGTRVAAMRNLIKMAVHKFNCRDYDVSPREKLRIRNINVPAASYNFCVARLPADTKFLRTRMVEGPLLAVHCRNEVRFKSREGLLGLTSDFVGEKFDLFRELGGMLMLAKQRARAGQPISKGSSEDQWWAVKDRWGGGETRWGQLASEVFEDDDPSWSPKERQMQLERKEKEDEERRKQQAAEATDLKHLTPEDLMSGRSTPSSGRPKKKKKSGEDGGNGKDRAEYKDGRRLVYVSPLRRKWYQEWLKIRPNGPCLDEKMICRAIGKQTDGKGTSSWDDIYMLSAANHHACILRMSVHDNYLKWLETGKGSDPKSADAPLKSSRPRQDHVLYVSRSAWLDLFNIEQRKELLIGIWRILSWINRAEVPKEDIEKMYELKRQEQQPEASGDVEMAI